MELGSTWMRDFTTSDPTSGAIHDADAIPDAAIFENSSPAPMAYIPVVAQRGVLTGQYFVTIVATEAHGFVKGNSYNVVITAAVSGVAGKQVVDSFLIEDVMDKKTNVAALMDVPIPDSFVPDFAALDIEQPMSMTDKFGPDSEYEFRDEFLAGYDLDAKAWNSDALASDEIKSEVSLWQDAINAYDVAFRVWKASYDIERLVQWRATLADRLIAITE